MARLEKFADFKELVLRSSIDRSGELVRLSAFILAFLSFPFFF